MEYVEARTRKDREATLLGLAAAYQHRDLGVFENEVRPDMSLTLAGSSRLAGTYHGYEAFGSYLEVLREVMAAARKPIKFEHGSNWMVFRQVMVVSGPQHDVEMTLVVSVGYDDDGLIESFLVEPEDQGLFDYVVDTSSILEIS